MAEIFSTNFNAGLGAWTTHDGNVWPIGEEGSNCYACTYRSAGFPAQAFKNDLSPSKQGTVRFQFASLTGSGFMDSLQTPGGPYNSNTFPVVSLFMTAVFGYYPIGVDTIGVGIGLLSDVSNPLDGQLIISSRRANGALTPTYQCGPTPLSSSWTYVSDVIANLHDGNWHGLQLAWVYDYGAQTLAVDARVNNVLVSSFTMTTQGTNGQPPPFCTIVDMADAGVNRVTVLQHGPDATAGHTAIENYHLDDVAQVYDWPGMTNARQLTPTSCDSASASTLVATCPRTLTVAGQNLLNYYSFIVTDPGGNEVSYTIDTWTDTDLVVILDDDMTAGEYCITFNLGRVICTAVSCAGETFPICRKCRFPLPFNQNLLQFLYRLEFEIQSGVSPNASITINLSRDGGYTWPITRTLTAGALGAYDWRVYSTNFGQGRNWVCEFITDAPYFWALIQCYADMEQGTS